MAIDFRLTARQRELQLQSRRFAREMLLPALEAEALPTPEERFFATKPAYEALIAAGFLRKCIPFSAGGESAGLTDTAIMAEELYAVNASVTLTLIGTVLGLLPLLIGGSEEQRVRPNKPGRRWRAFAPPNRAAAPMPHRPHRARAFAPRLRFVAIDGSLKAGRAGFPRPQVGIARAPTF